MDSAGEAKVVEEGGEAEKRPMLLAYCEAWLVGSILSASYGGRGVMESADFRRPDKQFIRPDQPPGFV